MGVWTEFLLLRLRTRGALLQSGNKTYGAVKLGEFLDQLRNYKILEKGFAPWS
jgi:hypothetical protein